MSDGDMGLALAAQVAHLANELFAGRFSPPGPPAAPSDVTPSALNQGAGGASPAVTLPPVPGLLHAPPPASAPPPKESDLRAAPTVLASALGRPSVPYATVPDVPDVPTPAPYFLELAGMPRGDAVRTTDERAGEQREPFVRAGEQREPFVRAGEQREPFVGVPATLDFRPDVVPDLRSRPRGLDPASVKHDFPILRERVHGRRLVWLDNAATTQKPRTVIDRLSHYYEHENSNIHRGAHTLAARATDAYEAARATVGRFLNAPSPENIVFARGATEAINLVARSWGGRHVAAGDEIVITWLEHHANIVPWQQLCIEKGARLRVAPVDGRGQVILDEYEKLLGPRTRLVAFTQVSNALGTIVPVREMASMAHRHGAVVLVDGAQSVSHMPVDVQELDCDFFVFSGHKVFAPTGIGVLFGTADALEATPPWQGGGNMISNVTFERTTYQPPPGRFEAGTGSIADAVGLGAAIDYVTALGLDKVRRYEHGLLAYAEESLSRIPGLRIIGTAAEKAGVVSFVIDGIRTEDIGAALDREGIAVRASHHCAQPILRRFGLETTVRASFAPYNTSEDVDALVTALRRLEGRRPPPPLG